MLKKKCQIIITGHNNNDKVETFLQNIIRGTSVNGLTNLREYKRLDRNIAILRPLIDYSRNEITWLCRSFYLPIWSDITNYNFSIKRNRIRHELIPYLQNHFNPQICKNLTQFLIFWQYEEEYVRENTLKLYMKITHRTILSLNLEKLFFQHIVLQQRIIKLFFHYHFHKQISKSFIHQLTTLYKNKKNGSLYFNKLRICHYSGQIYVTQK